MIELVAATPELVEAELESPDRLAALIAADLPPDWPPEHHERGTLEHTRDRLGEPGAEGWWLHWFVWTADGGRTLAGVGGYVGPPRYGTVEIGYSVVPSLQRRGIATAAVTALIAKARPRGAHGFVANTLPELEPSIGVLRKLGFEQSDPLRDGVISFRLSVTGGDR